MMHEEYRDSAVEALILASPEPLPGRRIAGLIGDLTASEIARSVAKLNSGYAEHGSSFRIRELAGGYQIYILPEYVGFVEEMFSRRRKLRLSRAALETVAIVAYRQPTTKAEIEHIRGVASDGVIRTLLEKNLITVTGRSNAVGKPLQYGTTADFLKFFGLACLGDLPKMSEIEEMISSQEARNQTELRFELNDDGEPVKLNIADGTFDPEKRRALEEESHEVAADIPEEEPDGSDSVESRLVPAGEDEMETADMTDGAACDPVDEQPVMTADSDIIPDSDS